MLRPPRTLWRLYLMDLLRLVSLTAEGRSTATTVLVGSALRWMHAVRSTLDSEKGKVLGFTDDRQLLCRLREVA